ncbi:MAG: DUF3054 domain-containing protein [Acidimicrobiia bacterium]
MSTARRGGAAFPPVLAGVLDLACLSAFVAFGGRRHEDLNEGFSWYLEVLWPIVLGWSVVALLTRLYTRGNGGGMWLALLGTLVGGLVITQVLRGSLQDRPWIGIFTLVAFGFIGLTTFGWRLVGLGYRRLRPAPTA